MNIGAALAVMAVGAILSFAIHGGPSGLNLHVVGFILMAVGAAGLWFRMRGFGPLRRVVVLPRRRVVTTTTTATPITPGEAARGVWLRPGVEDVPAVYTEQRVRTPDMPAEDTAAEPFGPSF